MQELIRKAELRSQSDKLYATICVHECTDIFGPNGIEIQPTEESNRYYKVTRLSRENDVLTIEKFNAIQMRFGSAAWEVYYWALLGEAIANSGDKVIIIQGGRI